ncbi:MAG: ISKra4 family transposase [Janthinobacterium lividum]
MAKLVWRVKLVAELEPGVVTETELARIERDQRASLAELGLTLAEAKQLTAALQAQLVPAQVAALGACRRACEACGRVLASKGHYGATFRSLFGDVPIRVGRRLACVCQGADAAKSFTVLEFGKDALSPELAYVTARYAALAPFGKVAALLSELLPVGGAQHASTVRNRTLRVGAQVVQAATNTAETAKQSAALAPGPVVVGLDGGYVRNRHRAEGRRFEVIAGKVIQADGGQHRFALTRTGPAATAEVFRQALAAVGVNANTPATVLCDGDAGLWRLQREVLPNATPVLDWWHAAVRFEHALQAARSLGANTADARLASTAVRGLERAKWRLWHGRWPGCRRRLAALCRWSERKAMHDVAGMDKLRQHAADLLGYLGRNEASLVHYDARRQRGEPIATSFVESAVDEIISWRMAKAQQMRWSQATVQPFLDVRTAVLNDTLEHAFRQRHPGFRCHPANDDHKLTAAAA